MRTFKEYIQGMDIKEDTKKKYLRNLEEGGGNYCICTVINHFKSYVMGYTKLIESHVPREIPLYGKYQTSEEILKEIEDMLKITRENFNFVVKEKRGKVNKNDEH